MVKSPADIDLARLLPHLRDPSYSPLLARRLRDREQARILDESVADEKDGKPLPLRQEITKPGDPRRLRGIPAIGPGVGGASPGTQPEMATVLKLGREAERFSVIRDFSRTLNTEIEDEATNAGWGGTGISDEAMVPLIEAA